VSLIEGPETSTGASLSRCGCLKEIRVIHLYFERIYKKPILEKPRVVCTIDSGVLIIDKSVWKKLENIIKY